LYDGTINRAVAVDVTGITEALKHIYHADRLVKELTRWRTLRFQSLQLFSFDVTASPSAIGDAARCQRGQ
jgi:hypothetical protein